MTISYKTITPIQIGNLLHALAARRITWTAARVWLACVEMVAIRETNDVCCRSKYRRADKRFKLLHGLPTGCLGGKPRH